MNYTNIKKHTDMNTETIQHDILHLVAEQLPDATVEMIETQYYPRQNRCAFATSVWHKGHLYFGDGGSALQVLNRLLAAVKAHETNPATR